MTKRRRRGNGIVRYVDDFGRVVIPKELRKTFGIEIKDPVEVFADEDFILVRKHVDKNECAVTGEVSEENKQFIDGKLVLSKKGARKLIKELEKYIEE